MDILKKTGLDWRDKRLIKELYMGQQPKVKIADGVSESATLGRGVRQGCSLSPILFNIYVEALENDEDGMKVRVSRKPGTQLRVHVQVGGEEIEEVRQFKYST